VSNVVLPERGQQRLPGRSASREQDANKRAGPTHAISQTLASSERSECTRDSRGARPATGSGAGEIGEATVFDHPPSVARSTPRYR